MWKLNFQWQLLLEILLQRSCWRDMSKSAPKPRVGKYIPQKQPELVPSPLLCTAEAEEGACLGGRWNMMERLCSSLFSPSPEGLDHFVCHFRRTRRVRRQHVELDLEARHGWC